MSTQKQLSRASKAIQLGLIPVEPKTKIVMKNFLKFFKFTSIPTPDKNLFFYLQKTLKIVTK